MVYNQIMGFEEGDLVYWNYEENSMFVTVVAWESVRQSAPPERLLGGFELGDEQRPIFFYSNEATLVCKNSTKKNCEIKDVDQSKVILRNDEVLITLQDLLIEGKLIGHKVLLGDTQKWILA